MAFTFFFRDMQALELIAEQLIPDLKSSQYIRIFTPEERAEVVQVVHGALDAGGYFVTEQTQKLPPGTERLFSQITSSAQVYQRVG